MGQQRSIPTRGRTRTISGHASGWLGAALALAACSGSAGCGMRPGPRPVAKPAAAEPPRAADIDPAGRYDPLIARTIPTEAERDSQVHTSSNIRQETFIAEGENFDPSLGRKQNVVVFASTQHSDRADIYIKPLNGRVVTRLTDDPADDVMPAISPDGGWIAFASDRHGTWDLFVMPSSGGAAVRITDDPSHDLHPSWSPDGRLLTFCRRGVTSGRWEIWVVSVVNPSTASFLGYGLFPEWCPAAGTGVNGSDKIVFQRSRDRGKRTFAIWTLDYDPSTQQSGNESQIAWSQNAALISPTWSPDGRFVVYARVPNAEDQTAVHGPTASSIWMVGIDGHGEVPLTGGEAVDLMPSWGADNRLMFVSTRSGTQNLWALDLEPAITTVLGPRSLDADGGRFANVPLGGGGGRTE